MSNLLRIERVKETLKAARSQRRLAKRSPEAEEDKPRGGGNDGMRTRGGHTSGIGGYASVAEGARVTERADVECGLSNSILTVASRGDRIRIGACMRAA